MIIPLQSLFAQLSQLPVPTNVYNEVLTNGGSIRPHWQKLLDALGSHKPHLWQQKQAWIDRLILENGVTFNVHTDASNPNRSWKLEQLPFILPADEWAYLEKGIAQRARLLNSVIEDLYGQQTLIRDGLLPGDIVYGHPNFLWPCMGIRPVGHQYLHLYAADLARTHDGQWWITADHTQTPSGAGYALENRQIIARAFGNLYRDLQIKPLTDFFRVLRDTLTRLSPRSHGESPLLVVLTSGRFNESYFEHIYLARQLGFPLVEGSDLTVRNASVYLKTLSGLKRVHCIFRRLDDDQTDPLELRSDSTLGVPCLVDAARHGNVLISNALGTGLLENPAITGFLPAICEHWFKEPLLLPSLATWWCGEKPVLHDVMEHWGDRVIKGVYPNQFFDSALPNPTDIEYSQVIKNKILRRPYAYVAQEHAFLSQAPIWNYSTQALAFKPMGLRVFAVASHQGFGVMPGGLTRVTSAGGTESALQYGDFSKDTWVMGGRQARYEPPAEMRPIKATEVIRSDPYLPSRVIENLFWFGRYCERSENLARLHRIMLTRLLDTSASQEEQEALWGMATHLQYLPSNETGCLKLDDQLLMALSDDNHSNSLRSNLERLLWIVGNVRGKLSSSNWQALTELRMEINLLDQPGDEMSQQIEYLDRLLMSLAALSGFMLDDMTRDQGWHFLMMGRNIERLQMTCDSMAFLLKSPAAFNRSALEWMLELGNSTITYRTRYLALPQLIPVLDLLLLDPDNPHSAIFQINALLRTHHILAQQLNHGDPCSLEPWQQRLTNWPLADLESSLQGMDTTEQVLQDMSGNLMQLTQETAHFSEQLCLKFFAHIHLTDHKHKP